MNKLTKTLRPCKCTCGQATESLYRPGHDAKHVSWLLDAVLSQTTDRDTARAELPSVALQLKFDAALLRALDRAAAKRERRELREARKTAKAEKKQERFAPAEVKVGRWWYEVVNNEAQPTEAGTFKVNYRTKSGEVQLTEVTRDKLR